MIVRDPGHRYWLTSLDGDGYQFLSFVKRSGDGYPGNVGSYSGTTSQEVLRALIHRAQYVNNQIPCWQTRVSVWLMRAVVWLYEHRAAQRHGRRLSVRKLAQIESLATCAKCGHVECAGHTR